MYKHLFNQGLRYSDDIESGPKKKIYFFENGLQDEGSDESNIEIKPSQVTQILRNSIDNVYQMELLNEVYRAGPMRSLSYSSSLTEIRTPTNNTVLHIAAWYGNDNIVSLVVEHVPTLLFQLNDYNETALHIAARGGHIYIIEKLLAACAKLTTSNGKDLLMFVAVKNVEGNTMFHEAMLCRDKKRIGGDKIFKVWEHFRTGDLSSKWNEIAFANVNNAKQSVLYLAVDSEDKEAVRVIMENCPDNAEPKGLSPVVAAIMKKNQEILSNILEKQISWIHSTDTYERLPLHYAASIGYLEGVKLLLCMCKCCINQRDKYGYYPIHLASYGGHVEAVKKLLAYCSDPTQMLDTSFKRNILHVAAKNGKHDVVKYILLQSRRIPELDRMINQKDYKGNTPLLLAAKSCHPKTVFYLTWDERVDLHVVNTNNQTALEVVNASQLRNPPTRKELTLVALNSAGANLSFRRLVDDKSRQSDSNLPQLEQSNVESSDIKRPIGQSDSKSNENNKNVSHNTAQFLFLPSSEEQYKNMVQTLTLVSTLIITASVAACFAVPGEAEGKENNLCHAMFQAFIIFITISLFSSISATILLFWATLGLTDLAAFSLKIVMPILGIALMSLSLAFMAGLYTVIRELTWLANLFMVVTPIFVVVVFLLYILLFLPSSSTRKSLRYISYFPFLILAWLAE